MSGPSARSLAHQRRQLLLAALAGAWAQPSVAQFVSQAWPAGRVQPSTLGVDAAGQPQNLKAWLGQPVLLNFWASWCASCQEELPQLEQLAARQAGQLTVLALNVREQPSRAQRAAHSLGLSKLQLLFDPLGHAAKAWGVSVFPYSALIDTQGRVQRTVTGVLDWQGPQAQAWLRALRG